MTLRSVAELASARRASFVSFLLLGNMVLCSIAWVPEYIDRLGVTFAQWGLILGLAPLGAISAIVVAPPLMTVFGVAPLMRVGAILALLALVPLGFVSNPIIWAAINILFNFLASLTGVAVNTHGVLLQKKVRESILSGMHAGWSLGAVAAATTGGIATLFLSLEAYLVIVALTTLVGFLVVYRFLLSPGNDGHHEERSSAGRKPFYRLPSRVWLLALGLLCAVMPELAVFEWSAVLARETGADMSLRALPFGLFMVGMILGRLSISSLATRFNVHRLSSAGAALAGTAMLTGIVGAALLSSTSPVAAILWLSGWWLLAGTGLAPLGPTMMLGASSVPGVVTAQAIATLSFVTQSISIVAKIAMGAVAESESVAFAFGIPILALFLGAIIAGVSAQATRPRDLERINPPTGPLPVMIAEPSDPIR